MAATRTCEKAICPFCKRSRRAYELPAHMLTAHPADIRIKPLNNSHCIFAAAGQMEFCVCLTCKKGFVGDGSEPNQQRWITMHGNKTMCRSAHAVALNTFKQDYHSLPVAHTTPPITDTSPTTPPQSDQPAPKKVAGYIYCFSNESMPNCYKIGFTTDSPSARLIAANSRSNWHYAPFVENYSVAVSNAHTAETEVHTRLHQYRLHPKREFFRIDIATVKATFDQVASMD
jgi:hypothetical protein